MTEIKPAYAEAVIASASSASQETGDLDHGDRRLSPKPTALRPSTFGTHRPWR